MKYLDICTRKEFEHNGATKVIWPKCGTLKITDDGKTFIDLAMFPTTSFYCFEPKLKENNKTWDE